MNIDSHLTTLQKISEDRFVFNVPIYQRLYVWGNDQIDTLLEDLLAAYQQGNEFFYLGGTLVVERQDGGAETCFDLIDGQQRFTTLWMMSLAWRDGLTDFLGVPQEHGQRPRVSFSIRPDVDRFFSLQSRQNDPNLKGNPQIVDALASIRSFRDERFKNFTDSNGIPLDFSGFTRFVFEKVQLVLTRVPAHADLNKLFEVINNRGVQLQHHEILKAKMLSFLTNDAGERDRYATLWDACSHMGNYVEQNLRESGGITISSLFDNAACDRGDEPLAFADQVLAALHQHHQAVERQEPLDLEAVLKRPDILDDDVSTSVGNETYESREVRSIISFPMLLLHTLRIWLAQNNRNDLPRILDSQLLKLFTEDFFDTRTNTDNVKSFIRLLWETRYTFDKHVIKWVKGEKEEHHLICHLYLNTSRNSKSLQRPRPQTNEPIALLQSMLYHSQQITTHYWLTPFLSNLLRNRDADPLPYLRHLDNHLLSSQDIRSLAERSADFLRDENHAPPLIDIVAVLDKGLGVQFPHYWFYKLEFVLWNSNHLGLTTDERNSFRMTAKNSVEHISPQTAQAVDRDTVSPEILDTFGNLALVSRSLNSEYGNKPYNEKQTHFKNHNRDRIDSLKMAAIYRSPTWGDDQARAHQEEMIALLQSYLGTSTRSCSEPPSDADSLIEEKVGATLTA
jgi:hypothetical protein